MSDTSPDTNKRGRKKIPIEDRRCSRYIKCEHCCEYTEYNYKTMERKPPVVDPKLSPRSKTRAYRKRYLEKKEEKN